MKLCKFCNTANKKSFDQGNCQICNNGLDKMNSLIELAIKKIPKNVKTFSLSTSIPKEWQYNEEDVWTYGINDAQSIKSAINRAINKIIAEKTKLIPINDGDIKVILDFIEDKTEIEYNDLYIFGRYKKFVSGLSQSRWNCANCEGAGCENCAGAGKNYESVEERLGLPMKQITDSEEYILHASGREDVDATNTAGRPFVIMLKKAKIRNPNLEEIKKKIDSSKEVSAENLQIVSKNFVEIVTESHFDKEYEAEVEFERKISDEEIKKILELSGKTIMQKTPTRVVHRRADIIRPRKVHYIRLKKTDGKRATFIIFAEAGTYIKELISSDSQRTKPSFSSICPGKCIRLEVTKIDDGILELALKST